MQDNFISDWPYTLLIQFLNYWLVFLKVRDWPGRGNADAGSGVVEGWFCPPCCPGCRCRWVCEWACVCAWVCAWYSGEMPAICSRTMGSVVRANRSASSDEGAGGGACGGPAVLGALPACPGAGIPKYKTSFITNIFKIIKPYLQNKTIEQSLYSFDYVL